MVTFVLQACGARSECLQTAGDVTAKSNRSGVSVAQAKAFGPLRMAHGTTSRRVSYKQSVNCGISI